MKRSSLFFLISFCAVLFCLIAPHAKSASFFEAASDATTKAKVVSLASPYQVFYPYNDYLDGFDLWIENTGASGLSTFTLRNEIGNMLAQKTVTIPKTAFSWGGTRFHVSFSTPIPITSFGEYRIYIESAMPNLYVFYANTTELRQHDETTSINPSIGPANIGGINQPFSFKFALYESGDASVPIISGVTTTVSGSGGVLLSFFTNEAVDFRVVYGPRGQGASTIDYSGSYRNCTAFDGGCGALMSGILSGKKYDFELFAKDEWGNTGMANGNFELLGENVVGEISVPESEDKIPPLISDVRVIETQSRSVTIAWTTNEVANSSILLALNVGGMPIVTSLGDSTYELNHAISSGNVLSQNTSYIALISSGDASGNYGSDAVVFRTLSTTPTSSPILLPPADPSPSSTEQIVNIAAQNPPQLSLPTLPSPQTQIINEGGLNSILVEWETPDGGEPAGGYRVILFSEDGGIGGYYLHLPLGTHSAILNAISPGTYTAIVYGDNEGVFQKVGVSQNIKVNAPPSTERPFYEKNSFYVAVVICLLAAVFIFAVFLRAKGKNNNAGFTTTPKKGTY